MENIFFLTIRCLSLIIYINSVIAERMFIQYEAAIGKKVREEYVYTSAALSTKLRCVFYCEKDQKCLTASYNEESRTCNFSAFRVNGANEDRFVVVVSSSTVLSKKGCMHGWTAVGGTCYYFLQRNKNYNEAKNYCEQNDGKLAEPKTNNTFELLRTYMDTNLNFKIFWIGLYDVNDKDMFVWLSDGAAPEYTAWGDDEPDHVRLTVENCVRVYKVFQYRWTDASCKTGAGAICEN